MNEKTIKNKFSERLNKALENNGFPIRCRATFLGRTLNVTNKAAGKWLNGECHPTTEKILELAKLLDVSVEWLLTGKLEIQNMNPQPQNNRKLTFQKIILLETPINNLNDKEFSNEQYKIINGMLDGINTIISSWLKTN